MKRKTVLTVGGLVTVALLGAANIPAIAGGQHGWGPSADGWGPRAMMMQRMGGFGKGGFGPWGHGPMQTMADNPMFKTMDKDGNGQLSAEEAQAGITALQAEYDADKDGALSRAEFEQLFAKVTGGFAARPFAMLDANGDGALSAEEMQFPAQMMARMQVMQAPAKN